MALETKAKQPAQYGGIDHPQTQAEKEYDEAERKLLEIAPRALVIDLNDAANWRANDAYDFGVAWGLGQFPELDFQGPAEILLKGLHGLVGRLTQAITALESRVQ